MRILITGAGTTTACNFIKAILKARKYGKVKDIEVFSADASTLVSGRYLADKFFRIPYAEERKFIPFLLELTRKYKIKAIIPVIDYEFYKFAIHRKKFLKYNCKVIISSPQTIKICNDKYRTYKFLKSISIPVVDTALSSQLNTSLQFPLIIKPRTCGRASLDVYKVENLQELNFYLRKYPDMIIQRYLDGEEFTVDLLSDFEGKVIGGVVRRRIETKSGISVKGVTVKDRQLLEASIKIAQSLKIIGPCNIQFFRTSQGFFSTAEVNPRFSGGLSLSIKAGFNSPLLLVKLLKGEKISYKLGEYKEGLYMVRFWEEIFTKTK